MAGVEMGSGVEMVMRLFTLLLFVLGLGTMIRAVRIYPRKLWYERATYNFIMAAYVLHAIFFYTALIIRDLTGWFYFNFTSWSNVLRIHAAISILVKESLHIVRFKLEERND